MARRIVILLSVLLLAGVASAQITTERDNTPPLVAVTFPGPCSMHLDTPTNVTGIAYDPETGISDLRVWLVRDATGENAHDWENWNGLQWVPVVLIEDSVALPVQLHTETSTWITTGQMPSVADHTLGYNEKVHIFVRATNGHGLDYDWISCFMVVKMEPELTPRDD